MEIELRLTQGLRRSAFLSAERIATVYGRREINWRTLQERVARLAAGLHRCGASPGDRIGIVAGNSDRYIEMYYAIAWAGCVSVPFNTRWAPAEMAFALGDSGPTVLLVDSTFDRWAVENCADVPIVRVEPGSSGLAIDELVENCQPLADHSGGGSELACIFYTGGTTGYPKGVMLSHAGLVTNFLSFQAVAPYARDTVFLHTAPMFHIADACALFGLTSLGATHVVLPGFVADEVIEAINLHGVTALFLVPTMIAAVCEALGRRPADMSSVERLTYGASPISSAVLESAMSCFPNARFVQAYGQTELSPIVTALDHADHVAGRLRSAGRPVPTMEMRIVDDQFKDLPIGQPGEIVAKGPGVMLGYWRQPELTAQTISDGWLKTGDVGRFDQDGYVYLEDRVKDMIVSGGENVYSAEVENALMSHPAVLQCAVIGVPDARWGERVHAIVVLRADEAASERDLIAHCESLIANYKRPKSIQFRTDPLPLSGVGKVLKSDLRRPFWEGHSRQIS